MNTRRLIDFGLLIPVLSIFAITSIYYYELGYFVYLNIPVDYIRIELLNRSGLIFSFVFIAYVAFSLLFEPIALVAANWPTNNIVKKLVMIFILIPLLGISAYIGLSIEKGMFVYHMIMPLCCLVIGIIFYPSQNLKQPSLQEDNNYLHKYIRFHYGKIIAPLLIISALTSFILFRTGYSHARLPGAGGFITVKSSSGDKVILRAYENMTIYGLLDTGSAIQYIIVTSDSRSDTILYKKVKAIKNSI